MDGTILLLPQFKVGQKVYHRLFRYRGLIVAVERESKKDGKGPWYKVLVHKSRHYAFISERNVMLDGSDEPIIHPLLESHFGPLKPL